MKIWSVLFVVNLNLKNTVILISVLSVMGKMTICNLQYDNHKWIFLCIFTRYHKCNPLSSFRKNYFRVQLLISLPCKPYPKYHCPLPLDRNVADANSEILSVHVLTSLCSVRTVAVLYHSMEISPIVIVKSSLSIYSPSFAMPMCLPPVNHKIPLLPLQVPVVSFYPPFQSSSSSRISFTVCIAPSTLIPVITAFPIDITFAPVKPAAIKPNITHSSLQFQYRIQYLANSPTDLLEKAKQHTRSPPFAVLSFSTSPHGHTQSWLRRSPPP